VTLGVIPHRLLAIHHPVAVALDLPRVAESAATVEWELGAQSALDRDKCCGYIPSLQGAPGINGDLRVRLSPAVYR
jgi:hypothetical protein